jgi:hypothetical protein
MGDYTVVKPCLASVFSFMLLGISFWVSIQKQINQIAIFLTFSYTDFIFAILGMSDNIPSLDQIDSLVLFFNLHCFYASYYP